MASNTLPFPRPAESPRDSGRDSILSLWKRRSLPEPVSATVVHFPAIPAPFRPAPPAPSPVPSTARLYVVGDQKPSIPDDRLRAGARFDQARRIARQVEREIAVQAARQRSQQHAPQAARKPPASASPAAPAPRENRLLQRLRSLITA